MIDSDSWLRFFFKSKVSWSYVICALGLDLATCLVSFSVIILPLIASSMGVSLFTIILVITIIISSYSFHCMIRAMESDRAHATGFSLKRLNYDQLAALAFGVRGYRISRLIQHTDTALSGLFALSLLVRELGALLSPLPLAIPLIIGVLAALFFGFSNEPEFFFISTPYATPVALGILFIATSMGGISMNGDGVDQRSLVSDQAMPSDILSHIGIAFAIITFCLAGASTIPSIYVTLASAARRVKVSKPSTTSTPSSSLATNTNTSVTTPTISPVQVAPSVSSSSEAVNDWTDEVMIKRDGNTIHIFVKQAGRVIRVALLIISLFYMAFIVLAHHAYDNSGVPVSMHMISSLRGHIMYIINQVVGGSLSSSLLLSLVIVGIMMAGTLVLLYQKLSIAPLMVAALLGHMVREADAPSRQIGARVALAIALFVGTTIAMYNWLPLLIICGGVPVAILNLLLPLLIHLRLNGKIISPIEQLWCICTCVMVLIAMTLSIRASLLSIMSHQSSSIA